MAEMILVVDDETEIADLVEVYLKNEGYLVKKASCAAEALHIADTQPIALALLDVMLPDLDGFTLCRKIREKHLFPLIMLTAKTEDVDKITGLTLGADGLYHEAVQPAGGRCTRQDTAATIYPVQPDCTGTCSGGSVRLRRTVHRP